MTHPDVSSHPLPSDCLRRAWAYVLAGIDHAEHAPHVGLLRSFDARIGRWVKPYPEVTGYTIRGLLEAARVLHEPGYEDTAAEMGRALLRVQESSGPAAGAVPAADLKPEYYVFDTAQAVEGFISLYHHTSDEGFLRGAVRAGEFCARLQSPDGSFRPAVIAGQPYEPRGDEDWGLRRTYIQVRGAAGWHALGRATGDPRFEHMAASCRDWIAGEVEQRYPSGLLPPCRAREGRRPLRSLLSRRRPKLPERATYSHPVAYIVRGLLEDFLATGEPSGLDLSLRIVRAAVLPHVRKNGYLPYGIHLDEGRTPATGFSYVSGEAQYAWLLCRLWQVTGDQGLLETADRLLGYCADVQAAAPESAPGGLYQYATSGAEPYAGIHLQLHVWGTKFFAEALALRNEIQKARSTCPSRIPPLLVAPWTMAVVEESDTEGPGAVVPGLRFRNLWSPGPITLCGGPNAGEISVRSDRGLDVPIHAVPGFPGIFRMDAAARTSYSVFHAPESRQPGGRSREHRRDNL